MKGARSLLILAVSIAMTTTTAPPAAADDPPISALDLHRALPQDPLLVVAFSMDDPQENVDDLMHLLGRFGGGERKQQLLDMLGGLNAAAGISLEDDLLAQLGPQFTLAADLPPFDYAMIALQTGNPEALSAVLGRIGIYAEVRDAKKVDAALRALMALAPGEVESEDGLVAAKVPIWINEGGAPDDEALRSYVTVQYTLKEGRIALGFSEQWVRSRFEDKPPVERLTGGKDYARVFSQLDPAATRLTYVNLPRVRELVRRSQILTSVMESSPRTLELLRLVSASDIMDVGMGSTSIERDGGVRTMNFGPQWLSAAVMSSGVVAALAVPALIMTQEDGGGDHTVESIETIAEACEGFSTDTHTYPPTQGWVPVERIAFYLEPVYVADLPRVDAYDNPILYWSDGSSYRIISTGRDGQMDQDWSALSEPTPSDGPEGDIVFGDGRFLVVPDASSR